MFTETYLRKVLGPGALPEHVFKDVDGLASIFAVMLPEN